jgi:DNA-binding NtrC family response regulator
LRILETGEFFRVGSSQLRKADIRVIAATNKDLWQGVLDGSFREDLYYRLDTVKIRIPPLRERSEDIIPIFRKFVSEYATKYDSVFQGFSDEARELLTSYRWPGNIRELRNVAEQLVVLEKSQFIDAEKLQKYLKGRQHLGSTDNLPILMKGNRQQEHKEVHDHDRELIYRALVELRSDINDMKKMLGSFIYNSFTGGNQATRKALPSAYDVEVGKGYEEPTREDQRKDINLGMPSYADIGEINSDEGEDFFQFFQEKGVPSLEETEKYLIQLALKKFDGNRRKASEALGISERTLYRKLDQYELG